MRAFGVSRDSHWSHRAWKEALDLGVPLLSDWNGTLAKRFAAARTYRWMNGVPERSAFLLDPDGRILIADDHAIVRAGLTQFISDQPDMRVDAEASTGEEAIRLARLLLRLFQSEPEIMGLTALLLLQHARSAARFDSDGAVILLDDQDRLRCAAA